MKKFLTAIILASNLFLMHTVNAEIKTYEGSDEYVMSEFETIDMGKQRAKQKAERAAQEKAGVFLESDSEVVNMMVTKDEIRTITGGILRIVGEPQYKLTEIAGGKSFIVRATIQAEIDTDDITKWLNRDTQERSELVAQNIELQKAIAAQDAQIAELKRQLATKPQDAEKISAQFAAEDKIFLSNQKLTEAGKFYYNGDFNGARNLCTKAIELNTDNATAYSIRGAIYYRLNDFNSAVADFNKAIALNSSDYRNFYNRGLAHVKLNDFRKAVEDFSGAIQLNPTDADSYYNRAVCRQRLGDYYGSQEDLNKARTLGYTA